MLLIWSRYVTVNTVSLVVDFTGRQSFSSANCRIFYDEMCWRVLQLLAS